MVATNTMRAIAPSVSIWAVGGSTPGMSDDQFEISVNRKIEPMRARNGAGSRRIVSWIWLSMVETTSSSVAWVLDGMRVSRRVASIEPPASSAITAQATTTGSVIETGPTWNSDSTFSGDFTPASDSGAEAVRARRERPPQPRTKGHGPSRAMTTRAAARTTKRRLWTATPRPIRPSRMRRTLHHSEPKWAAPSPAPVTKAAKSVAMVIAGASIARQSRDPPPLPA